MLIKNSNKNIHNTIHDPTWSPTSIAWYDGEIIGSEYMPASKKFTIHLIFDKLENNLDYNYLLLRNM